MIIFFPKAIGEHMKIILCANPPTMYISEDLYYRWTKANSITTKYRVLHPRPYVTTKSYASTESNLTHNCIYFRHTPRPNKKYDKGIDIKKEFPKRDKKEKTESTGNEKNHTSENKTRNRTTKT